MIEQLEVGDIILLKKEYWDDPKKPVTGLVTEIKYSKLDPLVIFQEDGTPSSTIKEEIQAITSFVVPWIMEHQMRWNLAYQTLSPMMVQSTPKMNSFTLTIEE